MTAIPHDDVFRDMEFAGTEQSDARASQWFLHVNFIFCLLLQRFCVFVGGGALYWCMPVFLATLVWLLMTGRGRIETASAWLFGLFAAAALFSTFIAVNTFDTRINGISIPSLASVLLVYTGLIVGPTERFDGTRSFNLFVVYARWIAAFGIVQYAAQFAGVRLFAFLDIAPQLRPILAEPYFNYHPVLSYGSSIMRSNGFFLLEPSIFSQVLMLAVAIDVFVRRDWRFLPLYALAYLVTYAGTGLLAFAIAAVLSLILAPRSSGRVLSLMAVAALGGAVVAVALPSVFDGLAGRANELSYTGSSGYARYFGQFKILQAFVGELRTLIGFGPGALERTDISVAGSINPALKIAFEYGLIGLAGFATFVIGAWWRRDIAIVSLYLLVNYQLGGGYLLFMPFVVLATMVCRWSAPVEPD